MSAPKITGLRTIRIAERANILWLEISTDDGLTGLGEAFRGAAAVEAVIHETIAPYLIGRDARAIEPVSRALLHPYVGFGGSSAEVRAASAVDLALWDLAGQRAGVPIHTAMGGACRDRVRAYNTCAGYDYNSRQHAGGHAGRRERQPDEPVAGPYDDQIAFTRDAGALAQSLLSEGFSAMKIWPFDPFASRDGGLTIRLEEIEAGMAPFRAIRAAVGNKMEVMAELHSLWSAPAAERICRALEEVDVFWAEDPIHKMDDCRALADLRRRTRVPICASETLGGKVAFRDLLVADATDIVMLDLTWCGGLTEARKIAALAEAFAKPVAPHDCTGPVTLMASLHLAIHAPTAIFQEVVRATLATWYRDLVTELPRLEGGMVLAPTAPGLGTTLRPEVAHREDAVVRVASR
ncbi:L-alanine-DL-glutamate epimerase-like enolase superfamily enzyme [Humitalea rosea]|uniref:L-alanine-DL-glutamate epimerase-like enolase superfamily enzyme n=1 Tax=Humitalea rosea TaxID=990373 RepID=A0A2W7IWB4_9PROT|nr:mandelate racemase/muconate lactonizing enzyme family protein [Humitalea rosea]PZW50812.1 L-alanine-DL-glutamate epimerase-like enolase superfamily enzyme [Humitalea rosea]